MRYSLEASCCTRPIGAATDQTRLIRGLILHKRISPGATARLLLPIADPSTRSGSAAANAGTLKSSYRWPACGRTLFLISVPRLHSFADVHSRGSLTEEGPR